MRKIFLTLFVLITTLMPFVITSCSGVTETGNPCPGGQCPASAPNMEGRSVYENNVYGVSVEVPEGWTFDESADSASVDFENSELQVTTAHMIFERLDPKPVSLPEYLGDAYADRTFSNYSTMTLTGYSYDDPAMGPNSGDLKEYFFLHDDLLIHVEAEIFESGRVELGSLLNGIAFE